MWRLKICIEGTERHGNRAERGLRRGSKLDEALRVQLTVYALLSDVGRTGHVQGELVTSGDLLEVLR